MGYRLIAFIACVVFAGNLAAEELLVNITREIALFKGTINGTEIVIKRNQNQQNTVNPIYAKTSRVCPPFCIQPMQLAPGVETVGELEIIDALKQMAAGDSALLLIDSRTPSWVKNGTIPGSVNIPWTRLNPAKGATTQEIISIMVDEFSVALKPEKDHFDVDEAVMAGTVDEVFDYSQAKTLYLFCNGMWCGQSPENIHTLLKFGYPAEKLKWYRGGMQDWEILGLSTVKPD